MTVVNPDSIAGITSVTSSGTTLEFYDVNGNLLDVSANLTGQLTVGTGATINSPAANAIDFETNGSERLRITSAGNVGIGTDNPNQKLHISATNPIIKFTDIDTNQSSMIRGANGHLYLDTHDATRDIIFRSEFGSATEVARITGDGKVGIGTNNPVGNLDIRDTKANLIVAKDGLTVKANSALHTTYDLIQLGAGGALASYSTATATADTQFIHNAYRHSGGNWKYRYADTAMRLRMNSPGGAFIFESAASGSADGDITFSEKLRITSTGLVGIGEDSPSYILDVKGDSGITQSPSSNSTAGQVSIVGRNSGGSASAISRLKSYPDGSSNQSHFAIETRNSSAAMVERLRIDSSGNTLIGLTDASQSTQGGTLQVKTAACIRRFVASAGSGAIRFEKTRSGTDSHTVVQADDKLGELQFYGSDGNSYEIAGMISAQVDGTPGDGDMPGRLMFFTSADGTSNNTERLRIDSSGKLLLGDTNTAWNSNSDTYKMSIKESSSENAAIIFLDTDSMRGGICGIAKGTNQILTGTTNVDFVVGSTYSNTIIVSGNGSSASPIERLRITNGGDIDIVGRTFHMASFSATGSSTGIDSNPWSNNEIGIRMSHQVTGGQSLFAFYNPNGQVGYIQTSGSGTIYNTGSDYRLKENQVSISDGITRLKQLKPYRFNFKKDTSTTLDGFFAHEVQAVVPEAIAGTKDEVVTKEEGDRKIGDPILQGMDYGRITPLLTAALQEAIAKIETLEPKVAALEPLIAKVATLEAKVQSIETQQENDAAYESKIDKIIDYFKL